MGDPIQESYYALKNEYPSVVYVLNSDIYMQTENVLEGNLWNVISGEDYEKIVTEKGMFYRQKQDK